MADKMISVFGEQSAFHDHTQTDADGNFSFTGLPPGLTLKVQPFNPALTMEQVFGLVQEVAPDQDHVELLWEPAQPR